MKNCFLLIAFILTAITSGAQKSAKEAKDSLPYQKYPTLPAFKIASLDSSTIFNTYNIPEGKPTALMLFSPDCEHCKMLTEKILANMDSMGDVQFYMFSFMSLAQTKVFYDNMKLKDYKKIKMVGKDYEFFFPTFYGAKYVPDIAIYDRHKKLVKYFDGDAKIPDLLATLKEAGK